MARKSITVGARARISYNDLVAGLMSFGAGKLATGCTLAKCHQDRNAALKLVAERSITLDDVYLDVDGNAKTNGVATVSLMPVIDCPNCRHCAGRCYDLANDVLYPACRAWRAVNSALLLFYGPKKFWARVFELVDAAGVQALRINVGGDLREGDFPEIWRHAATRPALEILYFTKNFSGLGGAIGTWAKDLPKNVHTILSRWEGDNSEDVTRALVDIINGLHGRCGRSVLRDPKTRKLAVTGVRRAVECCGNCSTCRKACGGCWGLRGGYVVFDEHGRDNKLT